jgi:hypothetical protein
MSGDNKQRPYFMLPDCHIFNNTTAIIYFSLIARIWIAGILAAWNLRLQYQYNHM